MSEDDCVYSFANIKINTDPKKEIYPNSGELVEDNLVSNLNFASADYKEPDGSVLNPCYKGLANRTARKDVDWRVIMPKMQAQGYEVGTLRLVRTLE